MKFSQVTVSRLFAFVGLFCLSSCAPSVPDVLAPDRVLHNGTIVTVDEDFSIAEAVAIKDGLIVAVGSNSEVLALAGSGTEKMDLGGKTVLPGFNDSHLHLAWPVGEAPNPAIRELGQAGSIVEIVDIVRREVEAASPGELVWIPFGPGMTLQIKEERWAQQD